MLNPNAIPIVPESAKQEPWKKYLQNSIVFSMSLFFLYIAFSMLAQAEVLYGSMIIVFTGLFAFVFLFERAYVWRYIFPGLVGVFVFVIFPIMYTLGLTFTNRSNLNLLTYDSAKNYFLRQSFTPADAAPFQLTLLDDNGLYHLQLEDSQGAYFQTSEAISFVDLEPKTIPLVRVLTHSTLPEAPNNAAIKFRTKLNTLTLRLPDGTLLSKSKLKEFSENYPLWLANENNPDQLVNQESGLIIAANWDTGFFTDDTGETYMPGFQINIGFENYRRIFTEEGLLAPFLQIFIWTLLFSITSVVCTFFIGMVLASFVQWSPIRFRGMYQVLLILPYAVPAFILFMIFRALFNQNFGIINFALETLFSIRLDWQTEPNTSRVMLLVVNIFMGYPYMFILSLGMLQSIPNDLYEATGLEGAGPLTNFFKITLPLVLKPMLPLLIASFAFNFNNFTLIQLMTRGGPIIIGSNPQAGETDLLVNYAYRLAFTGQTQDFALAATVSTFIFLLVGLLMVAYLKVANIEVGQTR
jgi:maltose/maltodextrin transport system permease protein